MKIMLKWKSSRFGTIMLAVGLLAAEPACAAPGDAADVRQQAAAERIVSQYKTVFDAPPGGVPSRDSARGPLLGNGSLGAVLSGPPEAQRFWLSKNNFWRLIDGHRTGGPRLFGGLEVNIPALAGGTYLTEQLLFPAVTLSRFTKGASTVTMRSLVAATDDVLLVELAVEGQPVEVETRLWAAPANAAAITDSRTAWSPASGAANRSRPWVSKNAVSVSPARNAGCRTTLTSKSRLVRTPCRRVRASASPSNWAARDRVGARAMTLASIGS